MDVPMAIDNRLVALQKPGTYETSIDGFGVYLPSRSGLRKDVVVGENDGRDFRPQRVNSLLHGRHVSFQEGGSIELLAHEGAEVFDLKRGRQAKAAESAKDARIAKLEAVVAQKEAKIAQKNEVISELMEENVLTKKASGEL